MSKLRRKIREVGAKVWPGQDFAERRAVVERGRSATWQVTIALIAVTIGAAAAGYLAVQLYYLPATLREARLNRVPSLTGMDLDDAVRRGEDAGYAVALTGHGYSDDVDEGEVIFQAPSPDTYLPRGDTLRVLVSLGRAEERVPDIAGLELALAARVLGPMRLRVAAVQREASDMHPQGTIIRTMPAAGTPLVELEGRSLTVVMSRGGSRLIMPDVRTLTLAQARDTLEVYSLTVGEVGAIAEGEQPPEDATVVVTGQDPPPGRLVPAGSPVKLTLGDARAPAAGVVQPPPARERLPEPRAPEEPPADEAPDEPAPEDAFR